jgi:hypothetical protein
MSVDVRSVRSHPALRAAAALAVLSTGWLVAQWPHALVHPAIGWFPAPLSAGLAAAVCFRTARLAGPAGRFWRHLGVIMLILLAGVLSSAVDSLLGPGAPTQRSSGVTMTLYIGAVLVLVWALLRLPIRRRMITFGLDLAVVVCATSLMAWFLAARGSVELARVTGTAWAIFGVLVLLFAGLLAVAKVALAGTGGLDRAALWVLGGTVLVGAALGAVTPLLESRPYLNDCHLSVPVCGLGIVLAALVQRHATPASPATPRPPARPFSLLPYVAVIVADGFVLTGISPDQRDTRILVGGSVVLTLLVVARQLASRAAPPSSSSAPPSATAATPTTSPRPAAAGPRPPAPSPCSCGCATPTATGAGSRS